MLVRALDNLVVHENLVREPVHERHPARLDDIARDANHVPVALLVAKRRPHAHGSVRCHLAPQHAHLVVVELDLRHVREERKQSLAECRIERVHRAVTLAHLMADLVANLELDGRLRNGHALRGLVFNHAVAQHLERLLHHAQVAVHEQLETRLGAIEMPARVLAFLDEREQLAHHRVLLVDARLDGPELFHNEGTARLVARDEHAVVADFVRVDMLETAADLHHAVNVGTALVRKRRIAHVRGMHVARQVHNLVHVAAQLAQPCNLLRGKELRAHLEMQVGSNRREVRVSATLAVTVHHALHHRSAALHGKQAVAHAQARVVMHVDADRRRNHLLHVLHNLLEFPRHRAAVRVAKHNEVRAAALRSLQRLESVLRVRLVAVKEMFRIVNHLLGMVLEVVDGGLDHVEVLFERRADDVRNVQIPALSKNRLDRSARLHERLQQRVLLG